MKTIFIVNPKAGSGKKFSEIFDKIKKFSEKSEGNVELYVTKKRNDAKSFVSEYCEKNGPARFIACGGDGTFNEVLNGSIACDGAEIGVVPIGTGNDFCRNFKTDESFLDLEKQVTGKCVKCDAIEYITNENSGYCANMFNIGFDCAVADTTNTVRKKTFLSGPFAYFVSIFINLVNKKPTHLSIEIDDKEKCEGGFLLTSIANGSYCGGGLKTNPLAKVGDGFININIVKNISLMRFLTLLPRYINGTYLGIQGIDEIVSSLKCEKVKITPREGVIRISIDGEIKDAGETEFKIVHNAFNFVVP